VSDYGRVLDVCCGSRAFYFDKSDARVFFCDVRRESVTVTDRTQGNRSGVRRIDIRPDFQCDFRQLPWADGSFDLVVFDPPHLVRAGKRSWLAAKYGRLSESWREDIARGFSECFRVLRTGGTLIFKWCEVQVALADVIELAKQKPLFGNKNPKGAGTHWVCFIKSGGAR